MQGFIQRTVKYSYLYLFKHILKTKKERENLLRHIRALEWKDFFENKENLVNDFDYNISDKLNVPKFSRPEKNEVSEDAKSYIQVITNKFRNLKIDVVLMYKRRNNLSKNHLMSLKKN